MDELLHFLSYSDLIRVIFSIHYSQSFMLTLTFSTQKGTFQFCKVNLEIVLNRKCRPEWGLDRWRSWCWVQREELSDWIVVFWTWWWSPRRRSGCSCVSERSRHFYKTLESHTSAAIFIHIYFAGTSESFTFEVQVREGWYLCMLSLCGFSCPPPTLKMCRCIGDSELVLVWTKKGS